MWARYEAHINPKETVAAMAYFCLTVLEKCGGGEKPKEATGKSSRYLYKRTWTYVGQDR